MAGVTTRVRPRHTQHAAAYAGTWCGEMFCVRGSKTDTIVRECLAQTYARSQACNRRLNSAADKVCVCVCARARAVRACRACVRAVRACVFVPVSPTALRTKLRVRSSGPSFPRKSAAPLSLPRAPLFLPKRTNATRRFRKRPLADALSGVVFFLARVLLFAGVESNASCRSAGIGTRVTLPTGPHAENSVRSSPSVTSCGRPLCE